MHYLLVGILVGFMLLMAFFADFHLGFTVFAAFFSVLIAMATYLQSRSFSDQPTKVEICVARLWMGFRAISCVSVGLIFIFIAIYGVYEGYAGAWSFKSMAFPLASLALGCMAAWVGLYGWSRNPLLDRALHAERKLRYGRGSK
jgi:hypothetical protein